MNRRTLRGRSILITGAARGIGAEVARLAAARGARVALIGLEPDRLAVLADELGVGTVWREAVECHLVGNESVWGLNLPKFIATTVSTWPTRGLQPRHRPVRASR